jgi:sporulation protein YlmC with PRC-barrel domain
MKMRKFFATISVVALAAAMPLAANAQSTDSTNSNAQQMQNDKSMKSGDKTMNRSTDSTQDRSTMTDGTSASSTQSAAAVTAEELQNTPIMNANDESIGDVNRVVIGQNGEVKQVIVGVGGFLGIGERNVAIEYDKLSIGKDADGNVKITTELTKQDLENMPTHQEN